jgi:hypothetical protein
LPGLRSISHFAFRISHFRRLLKLDANGQLVKALRTWSSPPHLNAMAAGPGGKLYVTPWADPALYRISDEDPVVSYLRLVDLST